MVWDGTHDIPYESIPSSDVDGAGTPANAPTRCILHQSLTLYRSDDLTGLLSPGVLESLALPGESYQAALTPGLLTTIFQAYPITNAILSEGGYLQMAGDPRWWMPSGRLYYSADATATPAQELAAAQANFWQPLRAVDPLSATSSVTYDAYTLLTVAVQDPVGNVTQALNDYRALKPIL